MAVGSITKRSVEAIPLPTGATRSYLWDDQLKGFGCMVTAAGSRSYLVQYQMGGRGSPTKRATIGRHGSPWTAEKARDRAADLLEMIRRGIDPSEKAKTDRAAADANKATAERLSFEAYVNLFSRKYLDAKGLRSAEDIKATFRRDLTPHFGDKPINMLKRTEIANLLDEISERSKSAAVKAHKWLRKLLSWAVERGDIPASPMANMGPPHRDGKRKRVLRGAELRAVWKASDELGEPFASFLKMLMLTGQRLREVAGANWSEINLDKAEWVIPGDRTKNGRDHCCPLPPQAIALLKSRFPAQENRSGLLFTTTGETPISGFSKVKARLDSIIARALAESGQTHLPAIQPWVYHDLRRSFSTGVQALGFPIEHTEACLNHVSGTRGGLAAIYQLHEYKVEKAVVMAAWAKHIDTLVSDVRLTGLDNEAA